MSKIDSGSKFDVNEYLGHIKRYFEYQKTLEGRAISSNSNEFLNAENIYLHTSRVSNAEDILEHGLFLNKIDPKLKYGKIKFKDGVIFAAKYFGGNISLDIEEVTVFIIDIDGLNSEIAENCPEDVWIYNDVSADRILGWFSYFPSNYSKGVKTSIDEASETQQIE